MLIPHSQLAPEIAGLAKRPVGDPMGEVQRMRKEFALNNFID
jgi:hypothetical protein